MNEEFEEQIWQQLYTQFGVPKISGIRFILSGKRKVRAVSENLLKKIEEKKVLSAGIYFATLEPFNGMNTIRLSIEGSQIIGAKATKNVIEIDSSLAEKWLKGEDIPIPPNFEGYVIVKDKSKNDFLGCGLARNGRLVNFFPKARRIA
ncbi:MAG: hypothetical protein QXK94_01750 [Candidatus Jordarchaeales archaeon]